MIPVGKQDLVGWWDIHWFQGIFHLLDKWDLVGGFKISYKPWDWSLSPHPFFAMVLVTSPTRPHLLTTSNPLSGSSPQKMVYVLNSWLIPPISIILSPYISFIFICHGMYHKWYISFYLILYHLSSLLLHTISHFSAHKEKPKSGPPGWQCYSSIPCWFSIFYHCIKIQSPIPRIFRIYPMCFVLFYGRFGISMGYAWDIPWNRSLSGSISPFRPVSTTSLWSSKGWTTGHPLVAAPAAPSSACNSFWLCSAMTKRGECPKIRFFSGDAGKPTCWIFWLEKCDGFEVGGFCWHQRSLGFFLGRGNNCVPYSRLKFPSQTAAAWHICNHLYQQGTKANAKCVRIYVLM